MSCNHGPKYWHHVIFEKNFVCLECKLEHVTMLAKQLYEALSITNRDCGELHHEKSQYHSVSKACPVVKKIDQVMADYEKWFHLKMRNK